VTDLVSIHRSWLAPGATAYVVPTAEARAHALAQGIVAERIHLLGMPVHASFSGESAGARAPHQGRDQEHDQGRVALGLRPDLPVVLLVGGGEGVGRLAQSARALMAEALPAQLVVICGHNARLQRALRQRCPTARTLTHVRGFVRTMPELMRAADVVVTKAGPQTISEAVIAGVPLILTDALPGQEAGNIGYTLRHGLGVHAPSDAALVRCVRERLAASPSERAAARTNAERVARPRAAFEIAGLILSLLS
jgi:1,2-diacylglycerol 3-beta-galactosyltransferase